MNVVIFHYHLKTGGVTSIIRSQIKALKEKDSDTCITILTGGNPEQYTFPGADIITEPVLNYLDPGVSDTDIPELFSSINSILRLHVSSDAVLHAHNLNLGKNPLVTSAISGMAEEGLSVLNHAHDFAEDRPDRMDLITRIFSILKQDIASTLYPQSMEYAVLNSSDRNRIRSKGIPEQQIHFLPNPVPFIEPADPETIKKSREQVYTELKLDTALPLFVYPVRAIQRKNIGEFILFAAAFRDRANWAVTRAPKNPAEIPLYDKFKETALKAEANIWFEAGEKCSFEDIMYASAKIITTSIREGFGMAFLEPWMYGKPVTGRDIPMVTDDFRKAGLTLNSLYSSIQVQGTNGEADFSSLDFDTQIDIIQKNAGNPGSVNADAVETIFTEIPPEEIEHNRTIINEHYSESAYGQKLCRIYSAMPEQH